MALNFIELNADTSLGYGLDFRVDLGLYAEAATETLYCEKRNMPASVESFNDVTTSYYYPTSAVSCEIVSDNAADNQTITIYYYSSDSDELPEVQQVTLNGTTGVSLSDDIFRCKRLVVTSIAGLNAGNVTIYESGNTGNILGTIKAGVGYSKDSYIWVPANTICVLLKVNSVGNCNDNRAYRLIAERKLSALVPSYSLLVQDIQVYDPCMKLTVDTQPPIPAGTTYEIKCERLEGTDLNADVYYEFVYFK